MNRAAGCQGKEQGEKDTTALHFHLMTEDPDCGKRHYSPSLGIDEPCEDHSLPSLLSDLIQVNAAF